MQLDLSLKDVREFIKKDDPEWINAVDTLLGLAIVCSPVFIGPAAFALLPIIAVKNEIVKIGKDVFKAVIAKRDEDFLIRERRMEVAYTLICFTAFFEALDRQISEPLRKEIGLLKEEKIFLAKSALGKSPYASKAYPNDQIKVAIDNQLASWDIPFPHPTETFAQQLERHQRLWLQMTQDFREFIKGLAFWEEANEAKKSQILAGIDNVPDMASDCFEAQYFDLARYYGDFAIWANLQEHKKTKAQLGSLSEYVQKYIALAENSRSEIDVGLLRMHEAVKSIPETLKISRSNDIANGLKSFYENEVAKPIAEESGSQDNEPHFHLPSISDAFIPQSFRVLRWTSKLKSLEDEATWNGLERRDDLEAFLLSYLSSPFSFKTPLVILGHPGSGKSLLTKVLSAKLMSNKYTIIRVPLREVNAAARIPEQIEEGIHQITSNRTSWADFSPTFKNNPPLVILDGYDELLQASGRVFSSYLMDVKTFEDNEAALRRPVRVIVTSRITLIDKATIPLGTTIIRLLEFDKRQRDKWISIWNRENAHYFKVAGIKNFALPLEDEEESDKIISLAEQPLLLLMLAIYDSEGNQLEKIKLIDRAILYNCLLRRFVKREKAKDKVFENLAPTEREKEMDLEVQRLAVAALGMYNRRKLYILSSELKDDINFFELKHLECSEMALGDGGKLTSADLLLGRFFFVHKSKAQVKAGAPDHHRETAAFEFLHNTFGEFLTADFILRQAMNEAATLKGLKENENLRAEFEKRLGSADGLSRAWFAGLIYTPLFTRPVILEMMREWFDHALKQKNLSKQEFLSYLDMIILNHLKRLLCKRELPPMMWKETVEEKYHAAFGDHPLLGHIAIYSINLILLRIMVTDESFIFDESQIETYEDGTRPWDRLTHIWRSWFSLENINGLTAVIIANRRDSRIIVSARKKLQIAESKNRLEICRNVSVSLGDNISSGLTGLILFEPSKDNQLSIEEIAQRLESENIDVDVQIAIKRLSQKERLIEFENLRDFASEVNKAFKMAISRNKQEELEYILLNLNHVIKRLEREELGKILPAYVRHEVLSEIKPLMAIDIALLNPEAGIMLLQLAKEAHDIEWIDSFASQINRWTILNHDKCEWGRSIEAMHTLVCLALEFASRDYKAHGISRDR